MDIRNIRHMSAVTGQRLENAPQAGQVALLYAGVTMGLHALVTAIDWILSQQVNASGGLSNLGTRSVFQAIQTMLPLVLPLITMCLDVGYLAAMLRVARRQFVSPQTLRLGFDRFWVLLRLTVIRGAIFTAIGFGCMYIGISIYLMTPLAQPLKELMIPLLQDQSLLSGGLAIDEATYNQLVSAMTPALLISGGIFLVGTAPVLFQYRMAEYVVVDKPAGMLIHPSRSQFTDTLANFVAGYYQKTGQAAAFHPVTRLDRDTFGVVLLGKNSHIHALLSQNPLEKTYEALVYGAPVREEGVIDAPIARRPLPSLLRQVSPEGKPSLTRYRVLSRQEKTAVLALTPVTGRTHQLRVHCAYMGFPIVGDPQYGSPESQAFSKEMGAATQLLCAKTLRFSHPITKTPMEIVSTYTIP